MVDPRCVFQAAMANSIRDNAFNLLGTITKRAQRLRHSPVDDFEIAAAGQLFEFHQREVRFNARCVTIHHKPNCARGGNNTGLCIAIAILLAHRDGEIPGCTGVLNKISLRTTGRVKWNGKGREGFVAVGCTARGLTVIAHHAQHVIRIILVTGKSPQFL